MEVQDIILDDDFDMSAIPSEKLKVIVELDENELHVSCEGPCNVEKWRSAYVTYWRRKLKTKIDNSPNIK